jgi:hypothetical protein
LHSNVEPDSDELKANDALVDVVGFDGPDVIDV